MTDPCSERGLTIVRRIQRIGNRLIHQRDDDLKALDLTSNQSAIILFVARNPGCQINDVRDHLEVTHQAACGLVDRMRSKGILDVRVSDEDARAKRVSLTEASARGDRQGRRRQGDGHPPRDDRRRGGRALQAPGQDRGEHGQMNRNKSPRHEYN